MSRGHSRKVVLINRSFQLSIMGWFALLSMILVAVFYISVWTFFNNFIREATVAGLPPEHVFFKFIADQQSFMNKIFILASIVSTVIIFVGGLFLSHKVAGPLYRLTQHLKSSSKGSVSAVKFRKGDYFMEIQDEFNEFIKRP